MDSVTPCFSFCDTEDCLVVYIFVPNDGELKVQCDGHVFLFAIEGYFLKLKLPTEVQPVDVNKGTYNASKKRFVFHLNKRSNIERLQDIDVITKFVLPVSPDSVIKEGENKQLDTISELSASLQSHHLSDKVESNTECQKPQSTKGSYGFANKYRKRLSRYDINVKNVIDLPNPCKSIVNERGFLKEKQERTDFDVDHYMADYFLQTYGMQCGTIKDILLYVPYWYKVNNSEDIEFTICEMEVLSTLDKTPITLNSGNETNKALLSMLDILLAYVYDFRSTLGENSSESTWNINKLSSTFSWLQVYRKLDDVVIGFSRRSLCYPLYRHWELTKKIFKDVSRILQLGRRQILKCFASIYILLEEDEDRYILNEVYLKDYLMWIQQVDCETLTQLQSNFDECCSLITKQDLSLNLMEIEREAVELFKHENEIKYNEWQRHLKLLKLESWLELESGNESSSESD